jgi:hypothetical protein
MTKTIDLDDIESRDDAYAGLAALVAEVERLRSINDDYLLEMGRQHALLRDQAREAKTERAAVVAYLREEGSINSMLSVLKGAADEIERGEHRNES